MWHLATVNAALAGESDAKNVKDLICKRYKMKGVVSWGVSDLGSQFSIKTSKSHVHGPLTTQCLLGARTWCTWFQRCTVRRV